jgi:predicted hydrocarbon binding protein
MCGGNRVDEAETLERGLVLAGLDALRQSQGDAVVRRILSRAAASGLEEGGGGGWVPIVDYLRYRDAALEYLGERFNTVAFETGRALVRNLRHRKIDEVKALLASLDGAAGKLPVIGQAAVLAAKGNPGVVRARMRDDSHLSITIDECPECRGLRRPAAFCFLNQGIITEFAARYLDTHVKTEETRCMAKGDEACVIDVALSH